MTHIGAEEIKFNPDYFEELARIEPHNFWFQSRNAMIVWALKRFFSDAGSFFEIGCGTGFVLSEIKKAFPHMLLQGCDAHGAALDYAKKRLPGVNFYKMDARNMPFENEFDIVGVFDVLEHIERDELVLSAMYKAARKGGGIILTVPQHAFLWSRTDEEARHIRRYKKVDLKNKVRKAGFELRDTISFMSLSLPIMAFSRLIIQKAAKNRGIMHELKINNFANTSLRALLCVERILNKIGVRFPFGGSLLLVAQKR